MEIEKVEIEKDLPSTEDAVTASEDVIPSPKQPSLMLAGALAPEGFKLMFVERPAVSVVNHQVPIVSQVIYQDLDLVVSELEATLAAARAAILQVVYNRGVEAGVAQATPPANI